MPAYARQLRKDYDDGKISDQNLIKGVLGKCQSQSVKNKRANLAERGITALRRLQSKPEQWVLIIDLYKQAGIQQVQTPSCGLWPWVDGKGCGVVEKSLGQRKYRIKKKFWGVVREVIH